MAKRIFNIVISLIFLFSPMQLLASDEVVGIAKNWQLYTQNPVTEVAKQINDMLFLLLAVSLIITILVFGLIFYVCIKFRASKNPTPSTNSHNTLIEIIWTVIPAIIVIALCVPSAKLIYFTGKVPDSELTLKVTGYQWYWGYEYPDYEGVAFDAYMKLDDALEPDEKRLLDVDNIVVLPIDTNIRVLLTGADVIHAWTIPAFGVKRDAVPGRLNEMWFNIEKPGIYYGQCSELCGQGHAFMPIVVKAVTKEEFAEWIKNAKDEYAQYNRVNIALNK